MPNQEALATVVVPTLNPGIGIGRLVQSLCSQSVSLDVLIVDSGSDPASLDAIRAAGVRIAHVKPEDFGHGATRNFGASLATTSVVCFMTQDAVPADRFAIESLIEPILAGRAEATYGRQVPDATASPLERFARSYNYPMVEVARNSPIRRVFFSNAFSAIHKQTFQFVGGFPTHTIMNEDMVFAARLRRAGYRVAYVPEAVVEHSHDYTLMQTFRRYFDIGVVFEQAKDDLKGLDATGEGIRYVRGLFTTLLRERQYAWLAAAVAESAAKWVGTFLGKRYKSLPMSLVRRLSMHRRYWDRPA